MNLFGVMDLSASALRAERVRAEVVASNMANAETTRTPEGGPYQRHHVVFSAQGGGSFEQSLMSQMNGAGDGFGSEFSEGFDKGFPDFPDAAAAANGAPGGVAVTAVIADNRAPLRR